MNFFARGKELNPIRYTKNEDLPSVSILMAAYNEEVVLESKLTSLIGLDYPEEKLQIYVGSDNSTDKTNDILNQYSAEYKHIHPIIYNSRQGKPSIINQLASSLDLDSDNHILLLTDASVILEEDCLFSLVRHFKNKKVGLVDAYMTYTGMKAEGISKSENTYLTNEVSLKQNESKVWGQMIGPFGGCFTIRAKLFSPVPDNFLVDDFYLAMKVLEQDYLTINDMEAICFEPVSHTSSEEFRRKKRISTGNFQNLMAFKHLLNPFNSLGFSFISHKVLRWLGPFFMLSIFISSALLALQGSHFFRILLFLQLVWYLVIPILDKLLGLLKIHFTMTRNISYFNLMNYALFLGFFASLKGVKSGIWQPTKRT